LTKKYFELLTKNKVFIPEEKGGVQLNPAKIIQFFTIVLFNGRPVLINYSND